MPISHDFTSSPNLLYRYDLNVHHINRQFLQKSLRMMEVMDNSTTRMQKFDDFMTTIKTKMIAAETEG